MVNVVKRLFVLNVALAVVAAIPARAAVISAGGLLGQYNAIVFDQFATAAAVAGPAVVGGNLTGGGIFGSNGEGNESGSYAAITVYGGVTGGGTFQVSGGGVIIAGSNSDQITVSNGGSATIGGSNSGSVTVSGESGTITVGGTNSGALRIGSGSSVFVGAGNSGTIKGGEGSTVGINGNNKATISLTAGGKLAINGSNSGPVQLGGGSMNYTGSQTGTLILSDGAKATQVKSLTVTAPAPALASFASTFKAPLTSLSAQLDAMAANSIATSSKGTITFTAKPDASGTAVFDIDSSFLKPNSTVKMNIGDAGSVIINVNVDGCVSNACVFALPDTLTFADPSGYASSVLWNFVNATGLSFPSEIGGTVLAPLASVSNSAPIDGTLVANSYSGGADLRSHSYTGTLPDGSSTTVANIKVVNGTVVAVPEPAGLLVIGTGLAALVGLRRRTATAPPAA